MLKAEANRHTPQSDYDKAAAEYYAKHGTVGEF
jgi:hypothetical protein